MGRPGVAEGPLGRVSAVVYWFVTVELLLVLTTAPGLVAALFLDRSPGNLPLYVLCAVPVGPAVSAALFAWRVFLRERDTGPAHHFWRGYRLNLLDALRVWVPVLILLAVLLTNVAFAAGGGGLQVPVPLSLGLSVVLVVWAVRMLVITSAFSFRWRDAARIAAFTITSRPLPTLGLLSLLVLTVGLAGLTFDAVVVLLGAPLTYLLARNEAPVLAMVQERFTEPDTEPEPGREPDRAPEPDPEAGPEPGANRAPDA